MKPEVRNTDTSDFYIIYRAKFRRNSSKSIGHQGYFVYYQNEHTDWETDNMDMESYLVIFTNQDKPCKLLSTKYDNTVNENFLSRNFMFKTFFYVSDVNCNNQKCADACDVEWKNVHESLGIQNHTRYLGCIIYIYFFLIKKNRTHPRRVPHCEFLPRHGPGLRTGDFHKCFALKWFLVSESFLLE